MSIPEIAGPANLDGRPGAEQVTVTFNVPPGSKLDPKEVQLLCLHTLNHAWVTTEHPKYKTWQALIDGAYGIKDPKDMALRSIMTEIDRIEANPPSCLANPDCNCSNCARWTQFWEAADNITGSRGQGSRAKRLKEST